MKALDTNLLVRFVTNDDVKQASAVKKLFEKTEKKQELLFVPIICIVEMIWVLESGYGMTRDDVIDAIVNLLGLSILKFEHNDCLVSLVEEARAGSTDLSDLLIALTSLQNNSTAVLTFDKRASKSRHFEMLKL